jgi:Holliday junction resolvase-like predicted endonuclease
LFPPFKGDFRGISIKTMNRKETGAIAENIAADYLSKRGYKIRERNYRTREGEIDIIAEKDGTLVFAEVRAKTGKSFGSAEESITERKKKRLIALRPTSATAAKSRTPAASTS